MTVRRSLGAIARSASARHATVIFGAQMAVNFLNYGFQLYSSRSLSVDGYGILWTLLSVVFLAGVPAIVLMTLATKLVAEVAAADEPQPLAGAIRSLRRLGFESAGVALVATAIGYVPAAAFLHLTDPVPVLLTGITVAAMFVLYALRGALLGKLSFTLFGISMTLEAAGRCGIGAALLALGFGVRGALAGYCSGTLLSLAVTIAMVRGGGASRNHVDVRRMMRAGLPVLISTAALTSLAFADVILVKHYFPASEAGLYSIVGLAGKIVLFLLSYMPTLVLPKAAWAVVRSTPPEAVLGPALLAVGAVAAGAISVYALAPAAVVDALGGAKYHDAAPLVPLYGLGMALLGIGNVAVSYRIAVHDFRFVSGLAVAAVGEVVAIALVHARLVDVVSIVVLANAAGLVASLLLTQRPAWRAENAHGGGKGPAK